MDKWLDRDNFAVFGVGRSGVAAANLLARRGKTVLASDTRSVDDLQQAAAGLDERVELVGGANRVGDAEVVVVSPGLRPSLDVFDRLGDRNVSVISEIELAYEASEAPMLAITGTDGKSTTTVLAGHVLQELGRECVAGGNLGTPLCELVDEVSADGYLVAEVSAFQLWSTHHFAPAAFGLTNIAFDHLNYFDHYDAYVAAKRRITHNAGPTTRGVFNMEDDCVGSWAGQHPGRAVGYGLSRQAVDGFDEAIWLEDGALWARRAGVDAHIWLPDAAALPIAGSHNLLDVMCAAGLVGAADISLADAATTLDSFEPLPHRLEYVGTIDGVDFYDDSKATNVHAALAGLDSLDGPVVPIVGGVDKGLELDELIEFLQTAQWPVVVIGELSDRLAAELVAAGYPAGDIHRVDTMEAAVGLAHELAGPAGTVSLSPACSSFDMFDSYAHRGEVFQAVVGRSSDRH